MPANIPDAEFPDMTNKPENPDLFQVGMSFAPDASELGPFSLMSFNAFISPPFTDLFDFTWELDGQVVPDETGPTILKPYAELPKTPLGLHTVKLTAKGAREYQDPTEAQYNVLPFNGGSQDGDLPVQGAGAGSASHLAGGRSRRAPGSAAILAAPVRDRKRPGWPRSHARVRRPL